MRILFLLGLVMNTFLINAQYQLPEAGSDSFTFTDGMGNFVEVDFDCKIIMNLIKLNLTVLSCGQLKMPCHH